MITTALPAADVRSSVPRRSGSPPYALPEVRSDRDDGIEDLFRLLLSGSAPIGGMFGNVEDSITQVVETALRNGINFVDTAYWYGQTRSESILGKILAKVPRKAYYISTKGKPFV
ncbi:unnamed protein product [Heligmosomoides polygyrus]|uniref:Aldo_ket_red domain-containing protein n=1 Tax=Heligmosomoides polygyrus TaxID=6339 RepID=A0A183F8W3_HELPZ|nr:unnamed protein product [Heligmosomoides polygyrus]